MSPLRIVGKLGARLAGQAFVGERVVFPKPRTTGARSGSAARSALTTSRCAAENFGLQVVSVSVALKPLLGSVSGDRGRVDDLDRGRRDDQLSVIR